MSICLEPALGKQAGMQMPLCRRSILFLPALPRSPRERYRQARARHLLRRRLLAIGVGPGPLAWPPPTANTLAAQPRRLVRWRLQPPAKETRNRTGGDKSAATPSPCAVRRRAGILAATSFAAEQNSTGGFHAQKRRSHFDHAHRQPAARRR